MIHYRRMIPADVSAAAAIEAAVLDSWSADTIARTLHCPASHCFVAVAQGGHAALAIDSGFSAVCLHAPQTPPQPEIICGFCACTLVADTCNLDAVSVAESHRRRGAGRGLVLHAMQTLRGAGAAYMWLEARSQNAAALSLYASLGFVQNGRRRGFYQDPDDDAVLMAALLATSAERV